MVGVEGFRGDTISKGRDRMTRKMMLVQTKDGQSIRVSVGAKPSRMIDPFGVLAVPPSDSEQAIESEMSKFIQKCKCGEIQISYP
jgi:hypothetical protein